MTGNDPKWYNVWRNDRMISSHHISAKKLIVRVSLKTYISMLKWVPVAQFSKKCSFNRHVNGNTVIHKNAGVSSKVYSSVQLQHVVWSPLRTQNSLVHNCILNLFLQSYYIITQKFLNYHNFFTNWTEKIPNGKMQNKFPDNDKFSVFHKFLHVMLVCMV